MQQSLFSLSLLILLVATATIISSTTPTSRVEMQWNFMANQYQNPPYLLPNGNFIIIRMLDTAGICSIVQCYNGSSYYKEEGQNQAPKMIWEHKLPLIAGVCVGFNNQLTPLGSTRELVFVQPFGSGPLIAFNYHSGKIMWQKPKIAVEGFQMTEDKKYLLISTEPVQMNIVRYEATSGKIVNGSDSFEHHQPKFFIQHAYNWAFPIYTKISSSSKNNNNNNKESSSSEFSLLKNINHRGEQQQQQQNEEGEEREIGVVIYATASDALWCWGFDAKTGLEIYNKQLSEFYGNAFENLVKMTYYSDDAKNKNKKYDVGVFTTTSRYNSSVRVVELSTGRFINWQMMHGGSFNPIYPVMTADQITGATYVVSSAFLWKQSIYHNDPTILWRYPGEITFKNKNNGENSFRYGIGNPVFLPSTVYPATTIASENENKNGNNNNNNNNNRTALIAEVRKKDNYLWLFICQIDLEFGKELWCENITQWHGLDLCNYTCYPSQIQIQDIFVSKTTGETGIKCLMNVYTEIEFESQSQLFQFVVFPSRKGAKQINSMPKMKPKPLSMCQGYSDLTLNCNHCTLGSSTKTTTKSFGKDDNNGNGCGYCYSTNECLLADKTGLLPQDRPCPRANRSNDEFSPPGRFCQNLGKKLSYSSSLSNKNKNKKNNKIPNIYSKKNK